MIESYLQQLRASGFRITPQRRAILQILLQANRHLTAGEVYQNARECVPGLTEATVYRTLNFLTQQDLVLAAHVGRGRMVYEIAGHDHHHLICRKCGQVVQIDHQLLEDLYTKFRANTGYKIDSIHTTFFGECPHCQADAASEE